MYTEVEDVVGIDGKLLCQKPAYDEIMNDKVLLQNGYEVQSAKVLQWFIGPSGGIAGKYDDSTALNSIVHDVESPDGAVKKYTANIITENMMSQVDSDRLIMAMMEGIIDHKKVTDVTVSKTDMHVVIFRSQHDLEKQHVVRGF